MLAPKGAAGAGVQGHAARLEGRPAAPYEAEHGFTIRPKVLIDFDPTGLKSFILHETSLLVHDGSTLEAPNKPFDEQTLAIRNAEDNSGTQRTALRMCWMPGLQLGCAWLREGSQIVHGCVHRTSGTGQTKGEGRPQGLRGAVQGGVTGNKGDIQGGAAAPGLEGPSWWLSEDPGAAGPTVGAFVEANRKHQNENKLHHTVCLRKLPVTVCRPDPKETAPTQVPLRSRVAGFCTWGSHCAGRPDKSHPPSSPFS